MGSSDSGTNDCPRVLFFGRVNCESTRELVHYMESAGFELTIILSSKRGEELPQSAFEWNGDYILCFRSFFVLPQMLIDRAKIAAINFHPGPPAYPGSGCVNFALFDEVENYGVTVHLMNAKIDNGNILEVREFAVDPDEELASVLRRAHVEMLGLCRDFINGLEQSGAAYVREREQSSMQHQWRGEARKMRELEALKSIDPSIGKNKLQKVIRATNIEGYPPYIELHGYKFYLSLNSE